MWIVLAASPTLWPAGPVGVPLGSAKPAADTPKIGSNLPLFYLWNESQHGRTLPWLIDGGLLPLDLVAISPEAGLSVSLTYDGVPYELAYDRARGVAVYPLRWAGAYRRVEIGRDAAGFPINIELPEEKIFLTVLEYRDGLPIQFRYEREGETGFAVMHYWDAAAEESWYSEAGELLALYEYQLSGEAIVAINSIAADGISTPVARWDYNAQGLVVSVTDVDGNRAFLYDEKNRPMVVLAKPAAGVGSECYFQWDELGRLVRQYGRNENGVFEYRYRYLQESKGLWISCGVEPWIEQYGHLVPGPEIKITRTFIRR